MNTNASKTHVPVPCSPWLFIPVAGPQPPLWLPWVSWSFVPYTCVFPCIYITLLSLVLGQIVFVTPVCASPSSYSSQYWFSLVLWLCLSTLRLPHLDCLFFCSWETGPQKRDMWYSYLNAIWFTVPLQSWKIERGIYPAKHSTSSYNITRWHLTRQKYSIWSK